MSLENTPTGTRENGPYDMWDKCAKEADKIVLEYKEINGEKKHLAPNGELSKLPEIYAKVVRTPTFLKWFGDWTGADKINVSKVIYEETGEPMLVFHGTSNYIPAEEGPMPGIKGKGVWFTNNLTYASSYLQEKEEGVGSMYPCFIKIDNPLYKIANHNSVWFEQEHGESSLFLEENDFIKKGLITTDAAFVVYSASSIMNLSINLPSNKPSNFKNKK
jgi:hypothetical protein